MRNIVYVVGAGLTKALETTKRVPLMPDCVSVMADYIYEDSGELDRVILTTLAELEIAGVFENTREDWKKLAQRVELSARDTEPDLTRGEAEAFKTIMQERPNENIERGLWRLWREGGHICALSLSWRYTPGCDGERYCLRVGTRSTLRVV